MVERRTLRALDLQAIPTAWKKCEVTVYSNLPEVELFANGVAGQKDRKDHFFRFRVPNVARPGWRPSPATAATRHIRKVKTFNEAYRLVDKGAVLNWFDVTEPEGFYER